MENVLFKNSVTQLCNRIEKTLQKLHEGDMRLAEAYLKNARTIANGLLSNLNGRVGIR